MGNPNANSLEGQASEPEANLKLILVTLALGLADHTWVEKTVEMEVDPEIDPDLKTEIFDAEEDAFQKWMRENESEANSLAPSFYKLIHWEWKD